MLIMPSSAPCHTCKHFAGIVQPDGTEDTERHACMAFTDIPGDILTGEIDHRSPYRGDGGVQYEAELA